MCLYVHQYMNHEDQLLSKPIKSIGKSIFLFFNIPLFDLDKLLMNKLLPLYSDNVQHTMVLVDVQMLMKLILYKLNQYNHRNYIFQILNMSVKKVFYILAIIISSSTITRCPDINYTFSIPTFSYTFDKSS
jgi:hypothetical protein